MAVDPPIVFFDTYTHIYIYTKKFDQERERANHGNMPGEGRSLDNRSYLTSLIYVLGASTGGIESPHL